MRIIVTGREGQVARALVERGRSAGVEVVCLAHPELDLTEPDLVARAIEATRGDVVINAAAYTAVDQAEAQPDLAMRVNGEGARAVAAANARHIVCAGRRGMETQGQVAGRVDTSIALLSKYYGC